MEIDYEDETDEKPNSTDDSFQEAIQLLTTALTDDFTENEVKIKAVEAVKRLFNPHSKSTLESKIFHCLTSSDFLDHIEQVQSNCHNLVLDKRDLMLKYGKCIISTLSIDDHSIRPVLLSQLKWIFRQLSSNEKQDLLPTFIELLWRCFEKHAVIEPDFISQILNISTVHVEVVVFDWIKKIMKSDVIFTDIDISYYVEASSRSPNLFQSITNIINQFLVKTNYHRRILQFLSFYLESLRSYCMNSDLSILRLYPKDCLRLVSLLQIPYEAYLPFEKSHNGKVICNKIVLGMLLSEFVKDRRKVMLLLTHFPCWMEPFANYVEDELNNF